MSLFSLYKSLKAISRSEDQKEIIFYLILIHVKQFPK